VSRYNTNQFLNGTKRMCTYIIDEQSNDLIATNSWTNSVNMQSTMPVFIMKWSGCTPSKNIGTAFVTVGMSFEPIASQRGIWSVQPRQSH